MKELKEYKELFDRNIERVQSLCKIYNTLKSDKIKVRKEYKFTDILRSAVVLLHSSFEEYYRDILGFVLPNVCNENDLKNMSFIDSEGNHKEKITLGGMLKFREKTVDQLITESIREVLSYTSFNDYRDIASWSNKIKIDLSEFSQQDELNKLIKRRHKIVHEADNANDNDKFKLSPINESTVTEWIKVVCNLVEIINKEISKENN